MKQFITILFLLITTIFFAQKITVFDIETGKPIGNIAVFNNDKSKAFITDNNGNVTIEDFNDDEIIYFSHITYADFQQKKSGILLNNNEVFLSKHSEQIDEVVVSVFKNKAKAKRIAEQIAVISKLEIQKISPQTSADLLANIAGIKVQKSQFGGGSPVLRGMESNRVLLVVDGVRMNNAIYRKGHIQNSITVNPNLLERTEVVFGPSSVIYGSDALGGVIHYYTKSPKLSEKKEIKSSLFSRFSTVNQEITTNVSAEVSSSNWASFTSVSYTDFGDLKMGKNRAHGFANWGKVDFYSENKNGNYTKNPTKNSNENIQRNTGFNQVDVLQKLYVPLSKNTDFRLNMQYSTSSNIPRFDKLTEKSKEELKFAEWYYGPQQRLLISPQIEIHAQKKWVEKATFTFAYQNIKESRMQRKFGSLNKSFRKENVDVFSLNGDFYLPIAEKRNLGYGFEIAYNDVGSSSEGKKLNIVNNSIEGFTDTFRVQSRYPDGGSSYLSAALYADYRQDISRKSTLNTGIRLTHTNLSAKWTDETFIRLPNNDISLNNTALTATIGYVFKPNKTWQLNTVLSSGFRSPNIDDVGKVGEKNGNVTVPNIGLKPEHAYNAEIGIQKYFNNRKFRFGINAYYTLLNNYIYRAPLSTKIEYDGELGNMVANVNKGNAFVTGITAGYQGKLHKNWTTSGAITYTKGKTYDTKEPLSSIPPLFGNFGVNYINTKIEAGANIRFNAKKDITEYNLTEGIDNQSQTPIINENATEDINKYFGSPSWMTLDVFGKYTLNKNVAFQGRLSNLFDQHYKEFASGVSAPGRNLSLSVLVNF